MAEGNLPTCAVCSLCTRETASFARSVAVVSRYTLCFIVFVSETGNENGFRFFFFNSRDRVREASAGGNK